MNKIKLFVYIVLLVLLVSFGAWAAGPRILFIGRSGASPIYAKFPITPSGYLLTTPSGYLVRTSGTENWDKLLATSDGKIIVTPSGYAIKVN